LKIYAGVQERRIAGASLGKAQKSLEVVLALGSWLMVVWLFSQPGGFLYGASPHDTFRFVYVALPRWVFPLYAGLVTVASLVALKRCVWDRWKARTFVPWPQLGLVTLGLVTNNLPFFVLPLGALPLAIAVASTNHIINYFGFVWMFERHRTCAPRSVFDMPQRLAAKGDWKRYFALAYAYSALVVGVSVILPPDLGVALIYLSNLAHYIIDGLIWRRSTNASVRPFLYRLANRA
jgi:hypothetical protein